jgi:hypothetical protein
MKKILLSMIVLLFVHHVRAQRFSAELIGGVNITQVDGDGFGGYYGGGIAAGFAAFFELDEKLAIGPEFMYSMKGAKTSIDQQNELGYPRFVWRINYFDVPLMARYTVNDYLVAQGGLSVNYLLASKIDFDNAPDGFRDANSNLGFQDARNLLRDFEYATLLGLEWKALDNIALNFRVGYSLLSNTRGQPRYTSVQYIWGRGGGFFNNYLHFSVRYTLRRQG